MSKGDVDRRLDELDARLKEQVHRPTSREKVDALEEIALELQAIVRELQEANWPPDGAEDEDLPY